MSGLIPLVELLTHDEARELLPEELSIISDACVLIALVKQKDYMGDAFQIANADDLRHRSSTAASVLRNLKRMLNRLYIED